MLDEPLKKIDTKDFLKASSKLTSLGLSFIKFFNLANFCFIKSSTLPFGCGLVITLISGYFFAVSFTNFIAFIIFIFSTPS